MYKVLRSLADLKMMEKIGELPPAMQLAYFEIPGGDAGTKETLERMRRIVWESVKDRKHGAFMRGAAAKIILDAGCRTKDYKCEARALHEWVRDKIRWTRDTKGMETLQYPYRTLEFGIGDCDDKSLLLSTFATTIGMPSKFRAIAAMPQRKSQFSHVYVMLNPNGDEETWVAADPTVSTAPLGWESPVRYRTMELMV